MLHSIPLADHRVIAVTGPDRTAFLQGQLTQDIAAVRSDVTVMAGWADAKGRLLFAGHLFSTQAGGDDALAMLAPADIAEALLKRLRMYVLRAKVQLSVLDQEINGVLGTPASGGTSHIIRILNQSDRHVVLGTVSSATPSTPGEWQLADIRAGLPEITTATSGEFVPQMVNLDLLGGISFSKGCYTGQEIVARMKYLGRVKRRMLRFSAAGTPPAAGVPVYAERGVVGKIVSSAATATGSEFLAVLVLDDLPGPFYLDEVKTRAIERLGLPYEVPV